ncbi:MAG: hypothetical protein ABW020_10090 [Candidatus Rokuibacteriota bacterium]
MERSPSLTRLIGPPGRASYIVAAQYTDEEYPAKVGWGHSSLSATVEVALKARA